MRHVSSSYFPRCFASSFFSFFVAGFPDQSHTAPTCPPMQPPACVSALWAARWHLPPIALSLAKDIFTQEVLSTACSAATSTNSGCGASCLRFSLVFYLIHSSYRARSTIMATMLLHLHPPVLLRMAWMTFTRGKLAVDRMLVCVFPSF